MSTCISGAVEDKLFVASLNKQATAKEIEELNAFLSFGCRPTANLEEPRNGRMPSDAWHSMNTQSLGPPPQVCT
ncbi:hypothetical protein GW17_00011541 [Ensete ventricosum]|nr:hypothetical protein GW17_00011541 [Ensete ventricosum]